MSVSESFALGLRVPPHSTDAEQAVLGGLMLAPQRIESLGARLSPDDFYRRDHRIIYQAMVELNRRGQPCDAVTLGEWFERNALADVTMTYLIELANTTPSAANIEAYGRIVREHATRRRVIDVASRMVDDAFGINVETSHLVDGGIGELMAMQHVEANSEFTLKQALLMAYEAADEAKKRGGKIPGIATGLSDLDELLGGWHDSDLIVIGARPAMGKTALLLNMALAAFRDGPEGEPMPLPAGLISTEQPVVQIGSRILSLDGGVKASRLRNGAHDDDELEKLFMAVRRLQERELVISDRATMSIADVQRAARRWKQRHDIKVLWVDYIQRIKGNDPRARRHEQVAEVAAGLKDIARELKIPVVALGQVGRDVEKRTDKRPNMGDLSDSSEIEKEADQILMLYRDEVYNQDTQDTGVAELNVEKNRHGPTGTIRVAWLPETMRFRDLSHRDAFDY